MDSQLGMENRIIDLEAEVERLQTERDRAEELLEIVSEQHRAMNDSNVQLRSALEKLINSVSEAYRLMNYFGSEDYMKQWSRTDGKTVLMEVYAVMADAFNGAKQALK